MYIFLQGTNINIKCGSENAVLVITDGLNKFTTNQIVQAEDGNYLHFDAEETKTFIPGRYNFQIIAGDSLEEEGIIKIKPNLLYADNYESFWRKVLRQCEERIAGKAIDPANSVTVGDKSIAYMSLSDLFKLRDFAMQKIAEEDEEEGIETSSPNSEKRIIYKWSIR